MKPVVNYLSVCSGIEAASVAMSRIPDVEWHPVAFSEIDPFACSVLAYHFPAVPNLGDLSKIKYDKDNDELTNGTDSIPLHGRRIHAILGGTPCFVAGTMVLTEKGYRPIESLHPGDLVVTHLGRLRKVLRIGAKEAETVAAKIVSRPPMRLTPDHKFWSATKTHRNHANHLIIDDCGFAEVQDMVGGYVAQQIVYNIPKPGIPKIDACSEEDVLELAGWYVGDGVIRKWTEKHRKAVVLCLNGTKLAAFSLRFSGKVGFVPGRPDGNGVYKVQICRTVLANWLEDNFGRLSHGKTVPAWLIGACDELRNAFARGYLATDGHTNDDGKQTFTTVSKSLAYGIADLLRKACVYYCPMPETGHICGRMVRQRPFYIVRKSRFPNRFHDFGKHTFVKVRSLGEVKRETVYQIEVEDDHSYVSNGIASRNCQDLSVAGKRAGAERGSGTRSSLFYEYARLVDEIRPDWLLFENVSGMLSSNHGRDFWFMQSALVDCGYCLAWRVLDAEYATVGGPMPDGTWGGFPRGIPQRRNRVWLVGLSGGDESAAAQILFEPPRLLGDTPPVREAGKGFACPPGYRVAGDDRLVGVTAKSCGNGQLNQTEPEEVAKTLDTMHDAQAVCIGKTSASFDGEDCSPTLRASNGTPGQDDQSIFSQRGAYLARTAFAQNQREEVRDLSDAASALSAKSETHPSAVAVATFENHAQDSRVREIDVSDTRSRKDGTGGNNLPLVVYSKSSHARNKNGDGERYEASEVAQTRNTFDNGESRTQEVVCSAVGFSHSNSNTSVQTKPTPKCSMTLRSVPTGEGAAVISVDRLNQSTADEVMHTIKANCSTGDGEPTAAYCLDAYNQKADEETCMTLRSAMTGTDGNDADPKVAVGVDTFNKTLTGDVSKTLNSAATDTDHIPVVLHHIVRRLTVIECSRLQGFPDLWLKFPTGHMRKIDKAEYDYLYGIPELRNHLRTPADSLRGVYETDLPSDSAAYRALGNSMATNCVEWILRRIVAAMRLGII